MIKNYITALATQDADKMTAMRSYTVAGQPADLYAVYQRQAALVYRDNAQSLQPETTTQTGDGYHLCHPDAPNATNSCADFTAFKVDANGKLVTFAVNGQALDGKLAAPGATTGGNGITVSMDGAYYSAQASALGITYTITNGTNNTVTAGPTATQYKDPDGIVASPTDELGNSSIPPSSKARYWVSFAGMTVGGSLNITVFPPSDEITLTIKVG
jgi:hypothetical protein